jgi:hypothetical protein
MRYQAEEAVLDLTIVVRESVVIFEAMGGLNRLRR